MYILYPPVPIRSHHRVPIPAPHHPVPIQPLTLQSLSSLTLHMPITDMAGILITVSSLQGAGNCAGHLHCLTGHLEVRIGGTIGRAHPTGTALQIGRHARVAVRGDNVGLLTQGVIT